MRKLTAKQKAFVDWYIILDGNASRAAEKAGYRGSYGTLRAIGSENLTKPNVRSAIDEHWKKRAMSRDEAIGRMADIARADGRHFISVDGDETFIDVARMIEEGKSHLIKSYTKHRDGSIRVELHDAKDALKVILSYHGEKVEPETNVNVTVKVVQYLRTGQIEPEFVQERWPHLAEELFRQAGIEIEPSTS